MTAPPESAAAGDWLAEMATVWVERWLAHGGFLSVDAGCDRVSAGMREGTNRLWRSRRPDLWKRQWHDGWKVGRWRELHEMASYVPGLDAAIVHHVALCGVPGPRGSTVMYRPAEVEEGA